MNDRFSRRLEGMNTKAWFLEEREPAKEEKRNRVIAGETQTTLDLEHSALIDREAKTAVQDEEDARDGERAAVNTDQHGFACFFWRERVLCSIASIVSHRPKVAQG